MHGNEIVAERRFKIRLATISNRMSLYSTVAAQGEDENQMRLAMVLLMERRASKLGLLSVQDLSEPRDSDR